MINCVPTYQICLKELGNNPETVISMILEDRLPPHLSQLDFSQPSGKPTPANLEGSADLSYGNSLIDKRENVFDNDEFDVFNKPEKIDLSRVQIGKK